MGWGSRGQFSVVMGQFWVGMRGVKIMGWGRSRVLVEDGAVVVGKGSGGWGRGSGGWGRAGGAGPGLGMSRSGRGQQGAARGQGWAGVGGPGWVRGGLVGQLGVGWGRGDSWGGGEQGILLL